ncbi:RNA-directed DNA polymerase [Paraburkholderia tropica]|uniref:RNA-directed DNA polymerase n=1 Tax=Paraburkholderia tropica TaxID=92647 RepID=UPI0007EC830B|nr:RNA-directed DNA polymerase [Paraburkholderia tropica]OBR47204.1 hypothetical protein A6456_32935 [Paraburkholderia tropica]
MKTILTEASLDFAREHITAFYDTDFYPKPFEYRALWFYWEDVKRHLLSTPLAQSFSGPPRAIAWPKARGGYRVVHQLEPLDSIVYVALVHAVAPEISESRMGPDVACSYRINVDRSSFFVGGSGFSRYRQQCEKLSAEYKYVLTTDISDFYNQIYLHRVCNAIELVSDTKSAGTEIERFITRLNNKASQGIPVGPAPSVVLAEAVMMDVDQHIAHQGFDHVRYVDDIRIFSDSKADLERCLESLVIYLHDAHRLNVVGEKTAVKTTTEFMHAELQNQYQLEKLDFLRSIEIANPYGEQAYSDDEDGDDDDDEDEGEDEDGGDDDDDDERSTGEKLLVALTRAHKSGMVDLAVIRAIIRRAKAGHIPDLAPYLLSEIDFFAPAANDVALYLASLPPWYEKDFVEDLRDACADGKMEKQCIRVWMEWLFSQRKTFMKDRVLRGFVNGGEVASQALAAVTTSNVAWAKSAKSKVLSSASWDRRAYIYALSLLASDERGPFIRQLLQNAALTVTDKWVANWVEKGCPEASPFIPF